MFEMKPRKKNIFRTKQIRTAIFIYFQTFTKKFLHHFSELYWRTHKTKKIFSLGQNKNLLPELDKYLNALIDPVKATQLF